MRDSKPISLTKMILTNVLLCILSFSFVSCLEDQEESIPIPSGQTNVQASVSGDNVVLSWNTVTNASFYVLYKRNTESASLEWMKVAEIAINSWTDKIPTKGYNYYKIVVADQRGKEYTSTPEYCNVYYGCNNENTGGNDNAPIAIPTGVTASLNENSIFIRWNSVTGATEYKIFRSSSYSGTYSLVSTVTSTNVIDNDPIDGNNYYKIKAVNSSNESDYSEIVNCVYEAKQAVPNTPTGLRAIQNGNTIVISWNAVNNVFLYRLWYRTPIGAESFVNVYAPETSCTFNNNLQNGAYTLWVQALNSDYEASASSGIETCYYSFQDNNGNDNGSNNTGGNDNDNEPTPTKLDAPTNLEAHGTAYDSFVQISFDEVSLANEYHLYRSTSPTYGYTKITASGGSTSGGRYVLTDRNPKSGTTYYKVKAVALNWLNIDDSDFSSYVRVDR